MPKYKHGAYMGGIEDPEHYIWRTMLRRKKHKKGAYYANVQVCEAWASNYSAFISDVGERPTKDHQLERINNKGHYEPGNVKWATRSEQQKNKSTTRRWEHNGEAGTLVEWAAKLGISKQLAFYRMKQHGTFERGKKWQLLKAA